MPQPIKYATTNPGNALRKGNIALAVNDTNYGPSTSTGWVGGVNTPSNGYVIHYLSGTDLRIRTAADDSQLITVAGQIMGTSYGSLSAALSGLAAGGATVVNTTNPPNIVTSNLLLNVNAGLVMSYPQANTTWYDISGNGYNGDLQNGVSFNSSGWFDFDGTNDQVATSINRGTLGNNMSVEATFKYTGGSGDAYRPIIGGNDPGTGTEFFLGKNSGNSYFGVQDGNYDGGFVTSVNVFDGQWHHMVYTYNNNTGILYLDGILRNSGYFSKCNDGEQIYIGAEVQEGFWWKGNISQVKYYQKTLSQSEILQNYYQGNIITSNLSYLWDAGNLVSYPGSGTTTYNMAGSVNGTLQNGVAFTSGNGGYWSFDGSDDRILLDNANYSFSLGDGNSNWTVNAWVRTTTSANGLGAGPILSNSNGGPVFSVMGINGGKIVYWVYPSNINSWKGWTGNITVNDGKWHMLTWVNKTGYTMDMYVDGILDTTISPTNAGNNNPIDIIGGCWASNFLGDIATVQVYQGKAFNVSEVQQNFNAYKNRFNYQQGNLIADGLVMAWDASNPASYPGSGTTIYDLSGNGNNGTLYNGVGFSSANGGVLTFDGVDDYVQGGPNLSSTNYTVIGAARYTSISGRIIAGWGNNWLLGHWAGYTNDHYAEGWVYYNPSISNTNWAIYTGTGNISGDNYQFFMNNVKLAENNGGSQGPNGISIGQGGGEYSSAQFSFLLVYNRVLSEQEITLIYNNYKNRFNL